MTRPDVYLDLDSDAVFDHVRVGDRERVGYILISDDGGFVPFDLLHRQVGPVGELDVAESLLDDIGLSLLDRTYVLARDGRTYDVGIKELTRESVTVGPLAGDIDPTAPSVDLTQRWTLALPAHDLSEPSAGDSTPPTSA